MNVSASSDAQPASSTQEGGADRHLAVAGQQLGEEVGVEEQQQTDVPARPGEIGAEDQPEERARWPRPAVDPAAAAGGPAADETRARQHKDERQQVDDEAERAAAADLRDGHAAPEQPQDAGALLEGDADEQHRQQPHQPTREEPRARRVVPLLVAIRQERREPRQHQEHADGRVGARVVQIHVDGDDAEDQRAAQPVELLQVQLRRGLRRGVIPTHRRRAGGDRSCALSRAVLLPAVWTRTPATAPNGDRSCASVSVVPGSGRGTRDTSARDGA